MTNNHESGWTRYFANNAVTWPQENRLYLVWRNISNWNHASCLDVARFLGLRGWVPERDGIRSAEDPEYSRSVAFWRNLPSVPERPDSDNSAE